VPLKQDLLLLFHDGQISSFSLQSPPPQINGIRLLPIFELFRKKLTQNRQQTTTTTTTSSTSLISIQHQNTALIETQRYHTIQNHILQQQHRPIEPEMATASSDGVIALWKKYF
jgi:hypothetical protein